MVANDGALPTLLQPYLCVTLAAASLVVSSAATVRPALSSQKTFGGTGFDSGTAIALDSSGNIYIAGTTTSLDFPTKGAFQPRIGGAGLHVSTNNGATWFTPSVPAPVYAVAGSPMGSNIVYAGTANGILKSMDGGQTWTSTRHSLRTVSAVPPAVHLRASFHCRELLIQS
jgi:hypothetical protein